MSLCACARGVGRLGDRWRDGRGDKERLGLGLLVLEELREQPRGSVIGGEGALAEDGGLLMRECVRAAVTVVIHLGGDGGEEGRERGGLRLREEVIYIEVGLQGGDGGVHLLGDGTPLLLSFVVVVEQALPRGLQIAGEDLAQDLEVVRGVDVVDVLLSGDVLGERGEQAVPLGSC